MEGGWLSECLLEGELPTDEGQPFGLCMGEEYACAWSVLHLFACFLRTDERMEEEEGHVARVMLCPSCPSLFHKSPSDPRMSRSLTTI